jgi:peptidoglycan hydrolase-like protein with peptidoglycan-binding domain
LPKSLKFNKNYMKLYKMFLSAGTLSLALAIVFSPLFVSAATLNRNLDLGMSGSDVSSLQTYFRADVNMYPSGLVTGYFGQLTQSAVQKFQVSRGIVTSGTPPTTGYGRVGPTTRSALNMAMDGSVVVNTGDSTPSINSISINTTNNSTSISWNTNENSSAVAYYSSSPISMSEGPSVTIGGSSILAHTDMRSSHSVMITSLNSNTTYYYVLYVRDANGNESITWPETFRTN